MSATLGDFLQPTSKCRRQAKVKRASRKAGRDSTVSIYFASQSGTASHYAHQLAMDLAKLGCSVNIADLKSFCPKTFRSHRCVILLASTYGNGEPPSSGASFSHWLDDIKMPVTTLNSVHFSVFGFGSHDYLHFNAFARHCDAGMAWFGAHRMCPRGEADASAGNIWSSFQVWKKEQLLPSLESTLGIRAKLPLAGADESLQLVCTPGHPLECNQLLTIGDEKLCSHLASAAEVVRLSDQIKDSLQWVQSSAAPSVVRVTELRQVVVDSMARESTKHIELLVDPAVVKWVTAGTVEIMPKSSMEEVAWFADRLNVVNDMDCIVALPPELALRPCTFRELLTSHCDLSGQLQVECVQAFAALTQDHVERECMQSLLKDFSTFQWLATDACLSLREFLILFLSSARIDVTTFFRICPSQKPRPYTIASSHLEDPSRIAVCASMVQRTLPNSFSVVDYLVQRSISATGSEAFSASCGVNGQRHFRGLCSTYLCNKICDGDLVSIKVRPSAFSLPSSPSTPMIMIAAGAGVAPFRGFVREIAAEGCLRSEAALLFGCRDEHIDFLYAKDLKDAAEREPCALSNLTMAFSRATVKQYVQHQVQASAVKIRSMFDNYGNIYVCGSSAMGRAVREVITNIFEAVDLESLVQNGRYVEELW